MKKMPHVANTYTGVHNDMLRGCTNQGHQPPTDHDDEIEY